MLFRSFSADGTVLYAADDQGIWQFKTTADLADSSSGSLVGLNDLQTLGVPYDGLGAAVDVVDTGVDASSPPFRGRVAPGTNVVTGTSVAPLAGRCVTTVGVLIGTSAPTVNWLRKSARLFPDKSCTACVATTVIVARGDRKSTRLNSSHRSLSRMPSSA